MTVALRCLLAGLVLAGWGSLCVLLACIPDLGLQGFGLALGALYGVGVGALVTGAFWARWFAKGLGWWGALAGGTLSVLTGVSAPLAVFAGSHLLVVILLGEDVAARYDGKTEWREGLDEKAQARIASLFSNLGSTLPYVFFYLFYLRASAEMTVTAGILSLLTLVGLARRKSVGILAAATVAGLAITLGMTELGDVASTVIVGLGAFMVWQMRALLRDAWLWLKPD